MTPKSVARELFAFGVGKEKKVKPKRKKSRACFSQNTDHNRSISGSYPA